MCILDDTQMNIICSKINEQHFGDQNTKINRIGQSLNNILHVIKDAQVVSLQNGYFVHNDLWNKKQDLQWTSC